MGKATMKEKEIKVDEKEVAAFAKTLKKDRMHRGALVKKSNADLLCEARCKLTQRKAREFAPRCSLYALRHSWATNALKNGVDALTVAILMGHRDPSTLARTYQHLSHNPEHLLAQAVRASD
jgi:site-specific recombinase XerD